MHNGPIAMAPPFGSYGDSMISSEAFKYQQQNEHFTLEEYFKGLQKFHPVENEVSHVKSTQVGGDHYQKGALQPWDIFLAWDLDPWTANVVKYILRYPHKNGIEDLRKAKHYIDFLISHYDEVKEKYYTKDKK
jgi:hypothetical protein